MKLQHMSPYTACGYILSSISETGLNCRCMCPNWGEESAEVEPCDAKVHDARSLFSFILRNVGLIVASEVALIR